MELDCHVMLAHLNLNGEYLPYKHIIGQVILDVSQSFVKYVFVSTRTIENQAFADSREQTRFNRLAVSIFQDGASSWRARLRRPTCRFSLTLPLHY